MDKQRSGQVNSLEMIRKDIEMLINLLKNENIEESVVEKLFDDIEHHLQTLEINLKIAKARKFDDYLKFLAASMQDLILQLQLPKTPQSEEYLARIEQIVDNFTDILKQTNRILRELEENETVDNEEIQGNQMEELIRIESEVRGLKAKLKKSNFKMIRDIAVNYKKNLDHVDAINQEVIQKKSEVFDLIKNIEKSCTSLEADQKLNDIQRQYDTITRIYQNTNKYEKHINELEKLKQSIEEIPEDEKFEEEKVAILKKIDEDLLILEDKIDTDFEKVFAQNFSPLSWKKESQIRRRKSIRISNRKSVESELNNWEFESEQDKTEEQIQNIRKDLEKAEQKYNDLLETFVSSGSFKDYKQEFLLLQEIVEQIQEVDDAIAEKKKSLTSDISDMLIYLDQKIRNTDIENIENELEEAEQKYEDLFKTYATSDSYEEYTQELLLLKETVDHLEDANEEITEKKNSVSLKIANSLASLKEKIKMVVENKITKIINEIEENTEQIQTDILECAKKNSELYQKVVRNIRILEDLRIDETNGLFKTRNRLLKEMQIYKQFLGDKKSNKDEEIQKLEEEIDQISRNVGSFVGYFGDYNYNTLEEEIIQLRDKLENQCFIDVKEKYEKTIKQLLENLKKKGKIVY